MDGRALVTVADGLVGPTQFDFGPEGDLWVAELGGGEDEGLGRVVRIDLLDGSRELVVEGLDKPTGLAVVGGWAWVMERDALGRVPVDGSGPYERIIENLPNNGRSEGSLTRIGDQRLLFTTTGSLRAGEIVEGSGSLWQLDVDRPLTVQVVATGFKNAYAHVEVEDGYLATEIGDGQYDGEPPPDELVLVPRLGPAGPSDGGWPQCVGATAVVEYGGTEDDCASRLQPVALFAPRSTPTSVAVLDGRVLVALWVEGRIVEVLDDGEVRTWYQHGEPGLQHLLVESGELWVSDHLAGRIVKFTRT